MRRLRSAQRSLKLGGSVRAGELLSDQLNHVTDAGNTMTAGLIGEANGRPNQKHDRRMFGVSGVAKSINEIG